MKKVLLLSSLIIVIFAGAAIPAIDWMAEASGVNGIARQETEEKILNSTVRIIVQTWVVQPGDSGYEVDHAVGHATVMDGRYLVTHNHFPLPLSIHPQEGDPESFGKVFVTDAQGQLLVEAPLSDFELILEEAEILVFAYNGDGLFGRPGLESAEFKDWGSLTLEAGMEVAQIDWDGTTTRVDWTTILEVKLEDGAPRLVLEDGAIPGASGGGIFLNGFHVANNWRVEEQVDASGAVVDTVTTVALNTAQVAS